MVIKFTPDGRLFIGDEEIDKWTKASIESIDPTGRATVTVTIVADRIDADVISYGK